MRRASRRVIVTPEAKRRNVMSEITVDTGACNGCGACTLVCIAHVYNLVEKKAIAANTQFCWRCGHCVAACPVGAIAHADYPLTECPILEPDELPGYEDLVNTFRERRSTRSFREKSIPRSQLQELLEIGRFAPTGSNSQNVDWLALDNRAKIQELSRRTVECLAATSRTLRRPLIKAYFHLTKGRQYSTMLWQFAQKLATLKKRQEAGDDPIFFRAPAVVVALAPKADGSARDNAVHALYNVELAARRLGLATCQMGFMAFALERNRSLREFLGVPKDKSTQAVLAIGYPRVTYHRAIPRRKPRVTWVG